MILLKLKNRIARYVLLLSLAFPFTYTHAQVVIGTTAPPAKGSLLELKTQEASNPTSATSANNVTSTKGGIGLPRVKLTDKMTLEPFVATTDPDWIASATSKIREKHAGLMVYNINISPASETDANKMFRQGTYTWDGSRWSPSFQGKKFFPCPAFNLPLPGVNRSSDPDFTYDLYGEYKKQFAQLGNNTFVSNASSLNVIAPQNTGKLYRENELDYVVTYYNPTILNIIGINEQGVMSYQVLNHDPTTDSFINLIFVIKE